jgi:hypothetical protein
VRLPGSDGKDNAYWSSAHDIAAHATTDWVRCSANQSLRAYEMVVATGHLPEPMWPEIPMRGLLELAFKGKVVDSPSHHILKRLAGEL